MNVSEAFKSRSMKSMLGDHLLRNGISYEQTRKTSSIKLLTGPSSGQVGDGSLITSKQRKVDSVFTTMNKLGTYIYNLLHIINSLTYITFCMIFT